MTNKMAVITGASAGIGAEYARQLAQRGYDLLLVARRKERLEQLAQEVTAANVDAEVYPCDLADEAQLHGLADRLRGRQIDLLINNAGFGTEGVVAETAVDRQLAMLNVHVRATYLLSQAVLPNMIARRQGNIINVSSIAGFMFSPENVNYCATKAYITQFSQGLDTEVREHGIAVQALCPGFTYTEFHDTPEMTQFERSNFPAALWMSAAEVVTISLDALPKGKVVVIPGRRNQMIVRSSQYGLGKIVRGVAKILFRRN